MCDIKRKEAELIVSVLKRSNSLNHQKQSSGEYFDGANAMSGLRLVKHAPGAPGLRVLGLGPGLIPCKGLQELQNLLNAHAFWAKGRNTKQLRHLLRKSSVVISLWRNKRMVGFGRATSDGIYRAVLWDIIVAGDLQGMGLGRQVIDALLASPALKNVEKIYLMTTHSAEFYLQLGFKKSHDQELLLLKGQEHN